MKEFTHLNKKNQPKMVNVGDKKITKRIAIAKAEMFLGKEIISVFNNNDLITKKGPVFQTAIIAGIQAVKKTSELIPMCHPLIINGVEVNIDVLNDTDIEIICKVEIDGKTGV
ncbi:cyclic pyranopterin monophosphate synthase MoaC, partial [Flavobacteriaceae bacterium AH-315-O20]|nr:cyclic pyranopterin monophosphate synthase MoaC [Flavobacteriaceae bacterium AH-315-O20]